jgi:hypothetical protein
MNTFFDLLLVCKNKDMIDDKEFVEYILDKYIVDPSFNEDIEPWLPMLTIEDLEELMVLIDEIGCEDESIN